MKNISARANCQKADDENQAQTTVKNLLTSVLEVSTSSSSSATRLQRLSSPNVVATLLTMSIVGGLFYLRGRMREHGTAMRSSVAGMGSIWAGIFFTSLFCSTLFGYVFMQFQKTLVHHKDVREYQPYFRYKSRFAPETVRVNGSV